MKNPQQPYMGDKGLNLIEETTTILDCLRIIGDSRLQIALVQKDNQLIGTVTDGDIRRGILNNMPLDSPASLIMNRSPVKAFDGISDSAALALMQRHSVHQLPIIDSNGRIISVKLIDELTIATRRENWVILMAGGLGERLKPLTNETPKPLIRIGEKPILETVLTGFIKAGFSNFFISVNYKAEMIQEYFGNGDKWGIEINYLHEKDRLGTAGALSLLPRRPDRPFFVMNGDLLTTVNFEQMLKYHSEQQAFSTVCVREHSVTVPFGVVELDNHRLISIREKPTHKYFVNAGVYLLDPGALDFIAPNEAVDMPTLIERTIAKDKTSVVFPLREYWIDVGRVDDLQRASEEFQRIFG